MAEGSGGRGAKAFYMQQMKKFLRGDDRQVLSRMGANRRRVCVLHATAGGTFSKVKNEGIAFERSSAHEFQFVLADTLQVSLNLFLFPVVTMNHNPNVWLKPSQLKCFEFTCLDGRINKGIVAWGIAAINSKPARRFTELSARTGSLPLLGDVPHRKMPRPSAPARHIQTNHRRISLI